MDDRTRIAADQLARMRGMTGMYHRQFYADINLTSIATAALFIVGWGWVPQAFLLIPIVTLAGAVRTAFDASYLIFARWYAMYLEQYVNGKVGSRILVASELEATYLFELGTTKIVTIPLKGGLPWFGFVTLFYTVIGAASFGFGLALGWGTLFTGPTALAVAYLVFVIGLTVTALAAGTWWFVGGEGERRLSTVLIERFGGDVTACPQPNETLRRS
jgi:TM2 domain-containing membrane protein YozV